jgi:hypothetical protein
MQASLIETPHSARQRRPDAWQHSETLFLLTCYDVWSATPPRGCACGDVAPIPAQP